MDGDENDQHSPGEGWLRPEHEKNEVSTYILQGNQHTLRPDLEVKDFRDFKDFKVRPSSCEVRLHFEVWFSRTFSGMSFIFHFLIVKQGE